MLEINPYFRPSARQLMKNPIFDEVRQVENEQLALFKIRVNIDVGADSVEPEDPELMK